MVCCLDPEDPTRARLCLVATRTVGAAKRIDGEHVLYRYLQSELLQSDIWLFQMLTARLIVGLGVWLSPAIYAEFPFLRFYAVRDPDARGNKAKGIPDQWGSPNKDGLFRDDNSLIKQMPYSLPIEGPQNRLYDGARLRKGFVASHAWRQLKDGQGLAARQRLTYSFVPNLVWLPREVSKLTDREGSFVQGYIQAISMKLYRSVPIRSELRSFVDNAWALLPEPVGIPIEGLPAASELNTFSMTEDALRRWVRDLDRVVDALQRAKERRQPTGKIVASRYGVGLSAVSKGRLGRLAEELADYRQAVGQDRNP